VHFEVRGDLKAPDACHCTNCRKQSGHYWASTNVHRSALILERWDKVKWYRSSEKVRRGFCSECGSLLFWDPLGHDFIAIAMGAFNPPTQTHLHAHIFVEEKGDYYDIADGVPLRPQY